MHQWVLLREVIWLSIKLRSCNTSLILVLCSSLRNMCFTKPERIHIISDRFGVIIIKLLMLVWVGIKLNLETSPLATGRDPRLDPMGILHDIIISPHANTSSGITHPLIQAVRIFLSQMSLMNRVRSLGTLPEMFLSTRFKSYVCFAGTMIWVWYCRVTRLHMSRQLNCRDMCKVVSGPDYHFSHMSNIYFYEILIMSS